MQDQIQMHSYSELYFSPIFSDLQKMWTKDIMLEYMH